MPGTYDESKHSRDESGRFSSTGGGEALKAFSKAGPGAQTERAQTAPSSGGGKLKGWATAFDKGGGFGWMHGGKEVGTEGKLETQMGKRRWENVGPKGMAAETWQGNYDKHPWQGGHASAERDATVHQPIVHGTVDKVKPPAPGEQKIAIFTMGGPGSGKSSMMQGLDESKFVHVDPDAVREQLPEYKQAIKGPMTYKGASGMTQAEAGDISSKIKDEAMRQGKHVIIDGTCSDTKYPIQAMEQFRKAGYKIHLAYAHLDGDEGMKRIAGRAEATGRDVDNEWAKQAYAKIPNNFEEMAKHADTFAVHATGQKGAPMVWSKGEDGVEKGDNKFIGDFKSKHFAGPKLGEDKALYEDAPKEGALPPDKFSAKNQKENDSLYKDAPKDDGGARLKLAMSRKFSPDEMEKRRREAEAAER